MLAGDEFVGEPEVVIIANAVIILLFPTEENSASRPLHFNLWR